MTSDKRSDSPGDQPVVGVQTLAGPGPAGQENCKTGGVWRLWSALDLHGLGGGRLSRQLAVMILGTTGLVLCLIALGLVHNLGGVLEQEARREASGLLRMMVSGLLHEYQMVSDFTQSEENMARDQVRNLTLTGLGALEAVRTRADYSGLPEREVKEEAIRQLSKMNGSLSVLILDTATDVIHSLGGEGIGNQGDVHVMVREMAGRGLGGYSSTVSRSRSGERVEYVAYGAAYAAWNWFVVSAALIRELNARAEAHLRGIADGLGDELMGSLRGRRAEMLIFNARGKIILHPDPCCGQDRLIPDPPDPMILARLHRLADSEKDYARLDGFPGYDDDVAVFVRRLGPLQWYVCLLIPHSEFTSEAWKRMTPFVVVLGLIWLGFLPLAWLGVRRIAAPVEALAGIATGLGKAEVPTGEESDKLSSIAQASRNESGELARSLLHLAGELARREVEGREAVARQAARAEERTARLEETNARLRQEIEERMRTQINLAESELRYRGMVEDQSELLLRFTPDGVINFANPAYCRFFGRSKEEIIGGSVLGNVAREDRQHLQEHLLSLGPERVSATIEHRVNMPDGSTRWLHWIDRAIIDHRGDVVEFQAVGFDVTDRVRTLDALTQAEATLRALFDSAGDMIVLMDLQGVVIDINKEGSQRLGTTQEVIRGRSVFEFMPPEVHNQRLNAGLHALKTGQVYTTLDRRGDLTYEATYSPIRDKTGTIVMIALFAKDITLRVRSEDEQVRQREELEAQVLERTAELEGSLAEIRAQMNERMRVERRLLDYQDRLRALSAQSGQVCDKEKRAIASELHDRVGMPLTLLRMKLGPLTALAPEQSLSEALTLLEEIISGVRELIFKVSPPLLYEMGLAEAVDWLGETILEAAGIRVVVDVAEAPVIADEDRRDLLFRCVRELFLNVVKHAAAGRVDVVLRRTSDGVNLVVRDDGQGFIPEDQPTREEGAGFGLFSIREQVEHLGGTVAISSAPGQGTAVVIVLPL